MPKSRFRTLSTLCVAYLMSIWTGCGDPQLAGSTGVGNPPQSVVAFSMVADQGPVALAKKPTQTNSTGLSAFTVSDKGGSRFTLESAFIHLGRVRFKLPDGIDCTAKLDEDCEEDHIQIQGPFVADLMTGSFTPAFPNFQAPHGAYRHISLRLEPLDKDAALPDTAMRGYAFHLAGTFSYGGRADRKFTILLDFNEEAQFNSGSMEVREQALNRMLLRFRVDAWLSQADITGCLDDGDLVLDANGNLRVDKDHSCNGLEGSVKDGIKASGDLEEDSGE
jgi:hypothetical protein